MTALAATFRSYAGRLNRLDGAWLAVGLILALVAAADMDQLVPSVGFTARALVATGPYILFAVLTIAYLKATGAEALIARAFEGRESRMIVFAALIGGLAPFCSCEVIPLVAGLLAVGTPVSAVMAFWLASPAIDIPTLLITAAALGWPFALGKAVAAVGVGLLGGFAVKWAGHLGWFNDPLRPRDSSSCGSCCGSSRDTAVMWRFWQSPDRVDRFRGQAFDNLLFLIKWLTLAYLLESLMIAYIPAEAIAGFAGGDGLGPIVLGALVGAPAYLNSYAAPPLVAGLVTQGMSVGAGMSFMMAGAITSIPAMAGVFALVKRQVFAAYLALGFVGAVVSGIAFQAAMSGM